MRIAIIGSGVSGLVAARLLHEQHEVTVFEARDRVGGHIHTIDVLDGSGRTHGVDIGFIVHNAHNYPLFTKLLDELGVESQVSDMSFGVRCDRTGVEYSTATVRSLFAQVSNAWSPAFIRMVRDILRFNRSAPEVLAAGRAGETLREYLERGGYGERLLRHYLEPMGSALWSIPRGSVLDMPVEFFVRFFANHQMLSEREEPEWRVIRGGSRRYMEALIAPFRDRIRTNSRVRSVRRSAETVAVDDKLFDSVVFACHSDQVIGMLADPTPKERAVLGSLPYQKNEVVLHTDTSLLPKSRTAWASWNYRISSAVDAAATVTYNMNRLQSIDSIDTFCVTLNDTDSISPDRILYKTVFRHPRFTLAGIEAQKRRNEISGRNRTHYCGAYWGFGFHEDGVRSGVDVARAFGVAG
ncbi:MAG: FAD-dependent oxidoreductase [Gemmatimonadota bacterium]